MMYDVQSIRRKRSMIVIMGKRRRAVMQRRRIRYVRYVLRSPLSLLVCVCV